MPTHEERRDSERLSFMRACPYELTKPIDADAVKLMVGSGYSINRSAGGMLLLLPEAVNKQQVLEITVPSEEKDEAVSALGEVCWTRPVPVDASATMHLVGIRFLFKVPASNRMPQAS